MAGGPLRPITTPIFTSAARLIPPYAADTSIAAKAALIFFICLFLPDDLLVF
jgi:hypothetical protein